MLSSYGRPVLWAAIRAILALVCIVSAVFVVVAHLPTDAADVTAGADSARAAELRQTHGLDQPVGTRLLAWWVHAITGDFGASWVSGRPAIAVVTESLIRTGAIAVPALTLGILFGTTLAVCSAWLKHRAPGHIAAAVVGVLVGVPEAVWVVLCVAWLTAVWTGLPTVSVLPPGVEPWAEPQVMVLPLMVLAVPACGWVARMVCGVADDVVARDVVRSARRRGVPTVQVMSHLVLPGVVRSALPVYAMVGVGVLSGSVVVESLLAYPGVGSVVVTASAARDIPVVMAVVTATTVVALVLLLCAGWGQQAKHRWASVVRGGM